MVSVRRVRADEWERVRELRIAAVRDPAAPIAFVSTLDEELAHDEAHWRKRAATAATGDDIAQFVAVVDEEWVGTATVRVLPASLAGQAGSRVSPSRAQVVGVFVHAEHRGAGIVDALLDAAAEWTTRLEFHELTLDVNSENTRAQSAYRRAAFVPTGESHTASIGCDLVMTRALRPAGDTVLG